MVHDRSSCDDRNSGSDLSPAGYATDGQAGGEALLAPFGSRVGYRTLGHGVFHCERCGGDRPYRHRSGRRWAHVLWLPVASLGSTGEHLRCVVCRTCYRVELLAVPTVEQMLVALQAATKAAVLAMLSAGGAAGTAARRKGIQVIRSSGEPDFDEVGLAAALAESGAAEPGAAELPRAREGVVPGQGGRDWARQRGPDCG